MAKVGEITNTTDVGAVGGTLILNAARPPVDGDGAAGNYWHDTAGKALYGPRAATPPPLEVTGINPSLVATDSQSGSYTIGMRMQFLTPGVVSALRFFRWGADPLTTPRTLTLYRAGVSVATANTVPAQESGSGWRQVELATPVEVDTGVVYVAAYRAPTHVAQGPLQASYSPTYITVLGSCSVVGVGFPSGNSSMNWFTDVVFKPTGVYGPMWVKVIQSAP